MYKIANENLAITKQDRKSAIEYNLQFVIKKRSVFDRCRSRK